MPSEDLLEESSGRVEYGVEGPAYPYGSMYPITGYLGFW